MKKAKSAVRMLHLHDDESVAAGVSLLARSIFCLSSISILKLQARRIRAILHVDIAARVDSKKQNFQ